MNRPLPSPEDRQLIMTKGLAPLARAYASQPRDPLNHYAPRWRARLRVAERDVTTTLRAEGVTIEVEDDGTVLVAFAGIRTTSRLGLRKALQNWKAKAEGKRVDGFYRRAGNRGSPK